MDDEEFAEHIELGQENARIVELASSHCQHMRFVESGGRGMLEQMMRLSLNSRHRFENIHTHWTQKFTNCALIGVSCLGFRMLESANLTLAHGETALQPGLRI